MLRPRTGEREFFQQLETQLSQSLYPTEGENVVEPRNIEEEIDLVQSITKEADGLREAERDEDDDDDHVSDTPREPCQVNFIY